MGCHVPSLIFSGYFLHPIIRCKLESLVVICIEPKRSFCFNSCLNGYVKSEVVLAIYDCSADFWTYSGPVEDVLNVVSDVSTVAGRESLGTK